MFRDNIDLDQYETALPILLKLEKECPCHGCLPVDFDLVRELDNLKGTIGQQYIAQAADFYDAKQYITALLKLEKALEYTDFNQDAQELYNRCLASGRRNVVVRVRQRGLMIYREAALRDMERRVAEILRSRLSRETYGKYTFVRAHADASGITPDLRIDLSLSNGDYLYVRGQASNQTASIVVRRFLSANHYVNELRLIPITTWQHTASAYLSAEYYLENLRTGVRSSSSRDEVSKDWSETIRRAGEGVPVEKIRYSPYAGQCGFPSFMNAAEFRANTSPTPLAADMLSPALWKLYYEYIKSAVYQIDRALESEG